MSLLDRKHFEPIFAPLAGKRVGVVDALGNIGDRMIWLATRQLLDHFGVEWKDGGSSGGVVGQMESIDRLLDCDVLLLAGGGNMGPRYWPCATIRKKALATGIPCIVLPQSFTGPEVGEFQTVYVRERCSLNHCHNGILAPDMALGLEVELPDGEPQEETGVLLRKDGEGLFRDQGDGDPAMMCGTIDEYLCLASRYRHVVTDRCHFAVASLMCGRKTTLLPNDYHKNRCLWETWLHDLGCCWAASPDAGG